MMELFRSLLFLSLTWWIKHSSKLDYKTIPQSVIRINGYCIILYTDSLCSLELDPRTDNVRVIIDCGDQCRLPSANEYDDSQCTNFFNTLGIEDCNQRECNQRVYNLNACITADTEINATNSIDSLCTLRLVPRTGGIGIIVNCGGQCGPDISILNNDDRCANLFNTLGIEQCNYQESCNQTVYDLSTCIIASTEINTTVLQTTTNQNTDSQYNRDGDAVTNSIATTEQAQACTPTIIYRTDCPVCQCNRDRDAVTNSIATAGQSLACTPTTVYRTETIDGSRMVEDNQPLAVIAALTIIITVLVMLLVTVSIALILTCWKPKLKRGLKRDKQQARQETTPQLI